MATSTLKLVMTKGPREGETLEFKTGSAIRIGRLVRGNTVSIKDAGISSKHISIEFDSGKWVIRDLDSSNGTFLNDSQLSPFTPFDLRHGDAVKIGEYSAFKVAIEAKIDDDDDEGESQSQLRRNPRRRVAATTKDLASETVKPGVGNRGRQGGALKRGKGLKEENDEAEKDLVFESVKLGVGNRGRRGALKRRKGLKEEDDEAELGSVSAKCDEELENVGPVEENRGQKGGSKRTKALKEVGNKTELLKEVGNKTELGLVSEGCDQGLETVGQVAENQGRQGGVKKRGRPLKRKDNEAELELVSGKCDKESENVRVVVESQARRRQPPRARKKNNEIAKSLTGFQDLEGKENVCANEEQNERQVSLKRTRSSEVEEESVVNPVLSKIADCSSLNFSKLSIEDKRMQEGLKETMNLQDEAPEAVEIAVSEEKETMNLQDEAPEAVEIAVSEEKEKMSRVDSRDEPLEEVAIGFTEQKENVEGFDLRRDTFNESVSGSSAKESGDDVSNEFDFENSTVEQWLDHLMVHLPKQMKKEVEKVISWLIIENKTVHEHMKQQKNNKGKVHMG